jgi:endonuclease/exonuclease/phosphatase family metal-dependent hydrolase
VQWTEKLGPDQLLIGDFNLKPDELELRPLFTVFRDAWKTAGDAAVTAGAAATHGESRIDFIFHRGGVAIAKVETVETSSFLGAAASDHRPLVATIRVSRVLK